MTLDEFKQSHMKISLEAAEFSKTKAGLEILAADEGHKEAILKRESAELLVRQYRNVMRPSLTLKAEIKRNDGGWTATYGDCVGEGVTPETACQDFDWIWTGKDGEQ
jgi:hypothetical protein